MSPVTRFLLLWAIALEVIVFLTMGVIWAVHA